MKHGRFVVKIGEWLELEPDVRVQVNAIRGQKVTLGVDAPRSVEVIRTELEVASAASTREGVPCS